MFSRGGKLVTVIEFVFCMFFAVVIDDKYVEHIDIGTRGIEGIDILDAAFFLSFFFSFLPPF